MPKINVSADEARTLKRKRAKDKAWNTAIMAAVEVAKKRLKKADPLETGAINAVLGDLRKMIR